jgi:hypothetical protein
MGTRCVPFSVGSIAFCPAQPMRAIVKEMTIASFMIIIRY